MTGTLTIVGAKSKTVEWDTDKPASFEAAKAAYEAARSSGAQAFAGGTAVEGATRVDTPVMPETDITMVPRFAGGR